MEKGKKKLPVVFCTKQNGLDMGHNIKNYIADKDITVYEIGKLFGYSKRTGVYVLLNKADISVDKLLQISIYLRHNFFKDIFDFYKKNVPQSVYERQHNELEIIKNQDREIKNLKEKVKILENTIDLQNKLLEKK